MGWEGVREESDPWLYNNSLAPPQAEKGLVCQAPSQARGGLDSEGKSAMGI